QREAIGLETYRDPARVGAMALVDECLHFDEERPGALARHRYDAAGDGILVTREEDRRRVAHFAQAVLCHGKDPDLVGSAESVLHCAHDPVAAAGLALEV